MSLFGVIVLIGLAIGLSENRRAIRLKTVLSAFILQFTIAGLILYFPLGQTFLKGMVSGVQSVIDYSYVGIEFLFGEIGKKKIGFMFAFHVLPIIVFFSALMSTLYYLGIMQKVVTILGHGLYKLLGTRKTESMSAVANIFVGQTEAPLVIQPYLKTLSSSQLFAVMTGGTASIAGAIMAGYASMGVDLNYLITASFMAAPGGLLMAKIIKPDKIDKIDKIDKADNTECVENPTSQGNGNDVDGNSSSKSESEIGSFFRQLKKRLASSNSSSKNESEIGSDSGIVIGKGDESSHGSEKDPKDPKGESMNIFEAMGNGALDGLKLALNIGAMLVAFVAMIALVNGLIGGVAGFLGFDGVSLQGILGKLLSPLAFLLGVPWHEANHAGSLIGQKLVINEFIAYINFVEIKDSLTPTTQAIITFALCGFANLSSIAILMGGLGSLVPERRHEIAKMGFKAVLAGTLSNLMSATLAGFFISLGL